MGILDFRFRFEDLQNWQQTKTEEEKLLSCCQDALKDYVDEQDNNEHDNEDWEDVDNDDDDDDDDDYDDTMMHAYQAFDMHYMDSLMR